MDARVLKMKHFVDSDVAEALVAAGVDSPKKVKAIKKADLEKLIGKDKSDKAKDKIKG